MQTHHTTVAVLGAGPAGLAVARELTRRSVPTLVVSPAPREPWPANYGIWVDEAHEVGLDQHLARRWATPLFESDHGRHVLQRAYAQIDDRGLQLDLLADLDDVTLLDARAVALHPRGRGGRLALHDGRHVVCDVVIDATGGAGILSERPATRPALQTAWGVLARVDGHPWEPGQMALMDFRGARADTRGTFLYALPYDDEWVFLEETSLAARPGVPLGLLGDRLSRRLRGLGIQVRAVHEVERCSIPMDLPIPRPSPRVVPFGAAAAFIHPASGYSLPRTFAAAPLVARALAQGLGGPGADPERAVGAAWEAAWPVALRRSNAIARLGLEVLMSLHAADLARFLDGFFRLPTSHWSAVLSPTAPSGARLQAMVRLGLHLPVRLQLHALARAGAGLGIPAPSSPLGPPELA